MRIFIDECVWQVTRDYLKRLDHDIACVEQRDLSGADENKGVRATLLTGNETL